MQRVLVSLVAFLFVVGCTATQERPMNAGEKTYVSDRVAQMVEENDGSLDTREHEDVYCERIRRTGTHLVERLCYTKAEKNAMVKAQQDELRRRFGNIKCMDQTTGGACSGGDPF
ncbi:MAG: hypothetical protein R3200_02325 [Xanthomonadales bacterium]|nr:hypothetical protein [Xanthomonadales bacterium]